MFKKARLKLTAWYVLIIMLISVSFSFFIYRSVTHEFQDRLSAIGRRINAPQRAVIPPPEDLEYFIEDLQLAKFRLFVILLYTNAVILILSSLSGYFLAGKTLHPIEETLEEQKRFIADASHELKTPLTIMKTTMEVASRDKDLKVKEAKEVLKESITETDNLTRLTGDLLSISRLGYNNIYFEKINLNTIIKPVVKKFNPLAKEKNIKIVNKIGDIKLKLNKEYFEKLISILLDNAIKYTKKGTVSISSERKNKYVIIKVKDSGIGIDKKDIPHIFERFYRADASRSKTQTPGFGLGLSLARQITTLHRGTINVQSEINKGSTFTLKLPLNF